jgi:hypothetical protein
MYEIGGSQGSEYFKNGEFCDATLRNNARTSWLHPFSSTLKMDSVGCSSITLLPPNQTTWCYVPEDS